jgi:BlaI family transcriptional regulator, penicillinase repressor
VRVLWSEGEATAARVTEALRPERRLASTTVATLLSRLEKKNVVTHRVDGRTFIYRARVSEVDVRRSLLSRMKEAFAGDVSALMAHLVRDDELSASDLAQMRELIEARERELEATVED